MNNINIDTTNVVDTGKFITPPITPLHLITHSGVFHADDVCCVSFIKYLFTAALQDAFGDEFGPEFVLHRVNATEIPKLRQDILRAGENYIVFDIGYGDFDHHQDDSPCREEFDGTPGIPLCIIRSFVETLGEVHL